MIRLWLTLTAAVILAAAPARAQTPAPPMLELGGNVAVVVPLVFEDGPVVVLGGGPRVAINLSRSIAVELCAEALGPFESSATQGLYLAQVGMPIRRSNDGRRTLRVTVALAGAASYQRFRETRIPRFDGSTLVHPGYTSFRVDPPNTVGLGLSRHHVLGRRATGSFGVQGFVGGLGGIAVRASAGIAFGIGGAQ